MNSVKGTPFTLEGSSEETQGDADPVIQRVAHGEFGGERSSAAEHRPHTTVVEGSIPSAPTKLSPIDIARFWGRITTGHDFECWPWRGQMGPKGYGRFRGDRAHRVAYELIKGEIPPGLLIRHSCDNPTCCNPSHLLVGTSQDNSDDAVARGRTLRGATHASKARQPTEAAATGTGAEAVVHDSSGDVFADLGVSPPPGVEFARYHSPLGRQATAELHEILSEKSPDDAPLDKIHGDSVEGLLGELEGQILRDTDRLAEEIGILRNENDSLRAALHPLAPGSKEPNAIDETGWLIELRGPHPTWWSLALNEEPGWTTDSLEAIRFARKEDAEAYINDIGWTDAFTTEHAWIWDGKHVWFKYRQDWPESCKFCGIVRRADDKNSPCKGRVSVGPKSLSSKGDAS